MAQPFATLFTTTNIAHPRSIQIKAIASLNGLTLRIAPDFEFGVTNKSSEYLSKFPLGKIPALEVTATGFLLTEASAIASYVAEQGPRRAQLLGVTPEERALVYKWVSFGNMHVYGTVSTLVGPKLGGPVISGPRVNEGDVYGGKEPELRAELELWLKYIDDELQDGRSWLVPSIEGVSVADITVAALLKLGMKYYVNRAMRETYPALTKWYRRVIAVPEVAEAFGQCSMLGEK